MLAVLIKGIPNGFQCAGLCDEGCCETFGKRKNTPATGECNLRFPKVSQHSSYKDQAILHTENNLVIVL